MTITARYPSRCARCGAAIAAGEQIEWAKGQPARHAACGSATRSISTRPMRPRPAYATPRAPRTCPTGGNCSSFGSGRSCGAPDCDGH